jgi:hypothetical protein
LLDGLVKQFFQQYVRGLLLVFQLALQEVQTAAVVQPHIYLELMQVQLCGHNNVIAVCAHHMVQVVIGPVLFVLNNMQLVVAVAEPVEDLTDTLNGMDTTMDVAAHNVCVVDVQVTDS